MGQPVVEIQKVTKTYDSLTAVDRVSLSLQPGQTLGLIGPNGAGKTTLLRLICSLAKPDSGDVLIQGRSVVHNPREARSQLGFMPAEFGSPGSLTIEEYLNYFGCLHGIPTHQRPARIADVCELTDLKGREHLTVKGLSTGNRQRVLLAKTLLHDPELLILDEPASGLDPRARTELRAIIRTLSSLGKTTIISSHILPDIEDISDQIAIMEAGRLVMDGNLQDLRQQTALEHHVVRMKTEQQETAISLLKDRADCRSVEVRDGFLICTVEQLESNELLTAMLQQNIRVTFYSEEQSGLEEIFLKTTEGKVT